MLYLMYWISLCELQLPSMSPSSPACAFSPPSPPCLLPETAARVAQNGHSSKQDRRKPKPQSPNVTIALSTRLGTRLATGLDSSIARPILAAAVYGSSHRN